MSRIPYSSQIDSIATFHSRTLVFRGLYVGGPLHSFSLRIALIAVSDSWCMSWHNGEMMGKTRPRPRGLVKESVRSSPLLPQGRPTGRKRDEFTDRGPVTKIAFPVPGRVAWKGTSMNRQVRHLGTGIKSTGQCKTACYGKVERILTRAKDCTPRNFNGRGTRPRIRGTEHHASYPISCQPRRRGLDLRVRRGKSHSRPSRIPSESTRGVDELNTTTETGEDE